ncbi:BtrH N-terminal domain-containing protein [Streptomyces sp. AC495_CC817]|uniref:BtrH N-terminal domain-containing protein n=1 Tax=Streptomyces sp. AC495_CC817 TaxID=2823900 RepID=UPI001C2605FE|nr:BtrH N-terminal domain-containing protein [Streptomyces sp. AC495_CC817]
MTEGTDAVVLDGVPDTGGLHCETTALGALLSHAGAPLSEPMLFGLGGGLSFVYWDSTRQPLPFLGGRVKPFELTRTLTSRLGLRLDEHETSSPRVAWDRVRTTIDSGIPVGLQLDSHDLEYFGSRVHFAGHVVAMYGYDAERAYLLDTAQQGGRVTTSLTSLATARAARGPMAARHRSFTIALPASGSLPPLAQVIVPAIVDCAAAFLSPPIANVGVRGIGTAATRMRGWPSRLQSPTDDLPTIAMLMERAGTGGALFRTLYRDFLSECLQLVRDEAPGAAEVIERGRDLYAEAARSWTEAARLIESAAAPAGAPHLDEAADTLEGIAAVETQAMRTLLTLAG